MLDLIHLLQIRNIPVATDNLKVHLAGFNGKEHPLDKYTSGRFDAWQAQQNMRNFECAQVLGLIDYSREGLPHRWLFAGLYTVHGCVPDHNKGKEHAVIYQMQLMPGMDDLRGRVIVEYRRSGRASYIWYQPTQSYLIQEVRPKPISLATFPGYSNVVIMHNDLQTVIQNQPADWKSALAHTNGIYVITDTQTGRHYVGQAAGSAGIWGRWCDYERTGHGGNKELKKLINTHGQEYAQHFQYAIVETMAMYATVEEIHAREQHWMHVLRTPEYGLN